MNIIHRAAIWLRVIKAYIATFTGVRCDIMDAEDTVAETLQGKSLIRFGDGEFGIFQGRDIHYQPWSPALLAEFQRIKSAFENTQPVDYILAVPKKYMQCSGLELARRRVLVASWAESRLYFKTHFRLGLKYGDAFLFEKNNKHIYSKIWRSTEDARSIIFVHNDAKCAEAFASTYRRTVYHIPCPPHDAMRVIDTLYADILATIARLNLDTNGAQIVISAGPAGKVLVYRLSQIGYQCIDTGHCWDDPLES